MKKFTTLSRKVIGAAIEVRKNLGPGLLESTYQLCLAHELALKNIEYIKEHPVSISYKGFD